VAGYHHEHWRPPRGFAIMRPMSEEHTNQYDQPDQTQQPQKQFRGWRLIGAITCVVIALAIISAIIDWAVVGPLEGRMF